MILHIYDLLFAFHIIKHVEVETCTRRITEPFELENETKSLVNYGPPKESPYFIIYHYLRTVRFS